MTFSAANAVQQKQYQPGRVLKESSAHRAHATAPPPAMIPFLLGLAVPPPPGLAVAPPPGLPCPGSENFSGASKARKRASNFKALKSGTAAPPNQWAEQDGSGISCNESATSSQCLIIDTLSDTDVSTAADQDGSESSAASCADIVESSPLCDTCGPSGLLLFGSPEDAELGSPQCPSIGSKNHRLGFTCKPCPFTDCQSGVQCKFCHLCDPGLAHLHLTGNCRPCLFFMKPEGCKSGADCKFCHYEHDARTSHRRHLRNRQKKQSKSDES